MTPTIFVVGSGPAEVDDVIPGSIVHYAGTTSPSGYLECDGTDYAEATYPLLFAAIGHTWDTFRGQASPGAGRFRVPLLAGLSPMYAGAAKSNPTTSSRTLGTAVGEEAHQLTTPELAAHAHAITDPGHTHAPLFDSFLEGDSVSGTFSITGMGPNWSPSSMTGTSATGITLGNSGGDTAHNTIHPVAVVRALIKT